MATNNLEVKFKVDATDVTRGSEDAKNKVKNAANEMASDVKNSSQKMEASMKDVANATEGIGEATKTATNAVKEMEREVDSSARHMERSLRNVSARQVGGLVARGLGEIGSQISENLGDTEGGALAGGALKGASAGIMMGALAGPIGMAAGGLVGAATGLMEAAIELKSAAQDQKMANFRTSQNFRNDIINRIEDEGNQKEVQSALDLFKTANGNEGTRFAINRAQELVDDRKSAYEKARNKYFELGKTNLTGNNEEDQKILAAIGAAEEEMDNAAAAFQEVAPLIAAITQAEHQIEQSIIGEINETKKRLDAEEARKKQMEEAARIAAEEDENERMIKRLERGMPAATAEDAEKINDHIAKLEEQEEEDKKKKKSLKGAFTDVGIRQTDSLTRIGGGTGYASFNNSTTQIQKNIDNNLKNVVKLMRESITETNSRLDALIAKDNTMTWAK